MTHLTSPRRLPTGAAAGPVARAPKLETAHEGVNSSPAVPAALVAIAGLTLACVQPTVPAPVGAGGYWPTYLGEPTRAPFARETVPTDTPAVLWISALGSGIRGMPIVTDEVIVAASADRRIYTVSRQDGTQFWRHDLEGQPFTPLLRADEIYAATADEAELQVLHMREGEELQRFELPSIRQAPALAGDTFFVATEAATLLAVSMASDEPLWTARFRRPASTSPLAVNGWLLHATYDSLFLLDRATGERRAAARSPEILTGELASDGTAVYAVTELGSIAAWRLPHLEPLWRTPGFAPFIAGPAIDDTRGYAVTRIGQLLGFDVTTGAVDLVARTEAPVRATPVVTRNGIIVGDLNGTLYLFGRNGETIWKVKFDGSIEAPVFVHEGRIIVPFYSRKGAGFASTTHGRIAELR